MAHEMTPAELKPGDRVYVWWDTGAFGARPLTMTVEKVNRKTVDVLVETGDRRRIYPSILTGLVDWE